MTSPSGDTKRLLNIAFRMPSPATMVSRKSSITNAFVGAIIPVITPSPEEIQDALTVLKMTPDDVRCAYCGDPFSEWDHLRPLVVQRRPTGYISEIANLVPSCGKCNQSKGNKGWRQWMKSSAKWSPAGRGVIDVEAKIAVLDAYELWKSPTLLNFEALVGSEEWDQYWSLCESVNNELRQAQEVADEFRRRILDLIQKGNTNG